MRKAVISLGMGIVIAVSGVVALSGWPDGAEAAGSPPKSTIVPLYNGHWDKTNVNEERMLIKKFGSTWYASDTTKPFIFDMASMRNDTLIILGASIKGGGPYNIAVKAQFGNRDGWKTPVLIDSLQRVGSGLPPFGTSKDSIWIGKPQYHTFVARWAGADRVRLIIDKDTAQTAANNLGTNSGDASIFPFVQVPKGAK